MGTCFIKQVLLCTKINPVTFVSPLITVAKVSGGVLEPVKFTVQCLILYHVSMCSLPNGNKG